MRRQIQWRSIFKQFLSAPQVANKNADPSPQEISIDPAVFAAFSPWSGQVPAGYWADWTGTFTRADVWAFQPEIRAIYDRERSEATRLPLDGEHVLDWVPLLQALRESSGTFRMAALGAGWGRWIAAGAALARQLGRDFQLLGVEAEPQHFEWMVRHMQDNNIPPASAILVQAAAAGRPGDLWFATGNSQAWYGQSIVSIDESSGAPDANHFRRVKAVTINDVLQQLSPIDYLHMDIQGTEAEFLRCDPEALNRCVRMVNIGTHGVEIEEELRALFRGLKWDSVYDIEIGTTHPVRVGNDQVDPVQFGDGVQVWRNPNFQREAI